ncbi:LysR family transcriptional regulator [Allocoprobacillus halotolerans]|uniref:LysR family transcriptional regulator n=1 Tax=Allocoprobacillus halotolerans TaxID=2944914 RepID=A0ABY5I5P0_9FIRM|nr:LysR family transcriptional regulator [Allocoprobacillus halotolerans]UTY40385.1 LysR family transcriptional regulator [Allocoprobacillus halotolerans]
MNIQQLKCFVEVAKTLHFTKTAQNLFISQTAVTNHIKHLEETLGFDLFIRTKKNVHLTQKGEFF